MPKEDDYLSDSSCEESITYVRPLFRRKQSKSCDGRLSNDEVSHTGSVSTESNSKTNNKIRVKKFDFSRVQKVCFPKTASNTATPVIKETTFRSLKLKPYGNVNGYNFLVTEDEYDRLNEAEGLSAVNIGVRINANLYNTKSDKNRLSGQFGHGLKKYWDNNSKIRVPIRNAPLLTDVNIEAITTAAIRDFYLESSEILGVPLKVLLRDQRIRWHPDRMMRRFEALEVNNRIITLLFQIINELWLDCV
ncbi:HBR203Wp [Eremothecium sinecaudum]|uniref:HBR203Wp n=1 Tax=Eremothecium sinecaudum TaxID=45286 RepID=A0A109UX30_9SACH|nr:HBR203Wp [Eremothecium sinecaudum]AMD19104.1 HBR203Wp [Eremothecium sinecaudum]